MSTNTQNYNLVKPAEDDRYDIGVYNGNMDKVDGNLASQKIKILKVENETMLHNDFVVGAKAGIDLSTGDVILQVSDYCKGLLVISTSHETNALILPTTDYHKYSIYNADEQNIAIVKKTGGQCIEIASCTMAMVGYDGIDYRMLGGGATDATRFKPTAIDSAVGDLTIVGWDKDTLMWKAMQNGYALYYGGYLYGNGSRVPIIGFENDDGLVVFTKEDGTLTSDSAEVRAGYIVEDGSSLLLDIKGDLGIAKEYTENMQTAYAVIGKSQTARVKSEMPTDASGYYLCYKSTAWTEGDDENTGTLIGNFTENYIDDNVWYTVEGLQNNNTYYLKWFPYKGDVVNRVIGVNEDNIYVQNGLAFWDFDTGISGNIIGDNFNNYSLSGSAIYTPFKVGNGIQYSGNYTISRGNFTPTHFSMLFWWRTSSLGGGFAKEFSWLGGIARGWELRHLSNGNIEIVVGNGSSASSYKTTISGCGLSANTDYLLCLELNRSTKQVKVYRNAVLVASGYGARDFSMSGVTSFVMGDSGDKADQMMILEGAVTIKNQGKIYNGAGPGG